MVNAVKSAESGNPKPAVGDNNKRQIKRVKDTQGHISTGLPISFTSAVGS